MLAYEEYYTYEDYRKWEGDWELIHGMPYAMAPFALPKHQFISSKIVTKLNILLRNCPKCNALMETEIMVSDDTILRPDVMVYCDEIKNKLTKTPPIIVEVTSKSTLKRDELIKKEIYAQEGVKYYILVSSEDKNIKIYKNYHGRFVKEDIKKFEFDECEIEVDFSDI